MVNAVPIFATGARSCPCDRQGHQSGISSFYAYAPQPLAFIFLPGMLPLWRLLVRIASWLSVSWLLWWIWRSLRILHRPLVCLPVRTWLLIRLIRWGGLCANRCGLKARASLRLLSQHGVEKGCDPQDQADDDQPDSFQPLVVIEPIGVGGVLVSDMGCYNIVIFIVKDQLFDRMGLTDGRTVLIQTDTGCICTSNKTDPGGIIDVPLSNRWVKTSAECNEIVRGSI